MLVVAALAIACSADTSDRQGNAEPSGAPGSIAEPLSAGGRPASAPLVFYPAPPFLGVAGDVCEGEMISCAGICSQHDRDPHNCGQCGTNCARGNVCSAGICIDTIPGVALDLTLPLAHSVCSPGSFDCGGGCVDVRSDAANCGACTNACGAGTTCTGGHCK